MKKHLPELPVMIKNRLNFHRKKNAAVDFLMKAMIMHGTETTILLFCPSNHPTCLLATQNMSQDNGPPFATFLSCKCCPWSHTVASWMLRKYTTHYSHKFHHYCSAAEELIAGQDSSSVKRAGWSENLYFLLSQCLQCHKKKS